jgi:hypothetical protein
MSPNIICEVTFGPSAAGLIGGAVMIIVLGLGMVAVGVYWRPAQDQEAFKRVVLQVAGSVVVGYGTLLVIHHSLVFAAPSAQVREISGMLTVEPAGRGDFDVCIDVACERISTNFATVDDPEDRFIRGREVLHTLEQTAVLGRMWVADAGIGPIGPELRRAAICDQRYLDRLRRPD